MRTLAGRELEEGSNNRKEGNEWQQMKRRRKKWADAESSGKEVYRQVAKSHQNNQNTSWYGKVC